MLLAVITFVVISVATMARRRTTKINYAFSLKTSKLKVEIVENDVSPDGVLVYFVRNMSWPDDFVFVRKESD